MLKYQRPCWDLWDGHETFEEWIAVGLLTDHVTPVVVLEQQNDGHVKYIDLTTHTLKSLKRECCFVHRIAIEQLHDSRTEAVLANARSDVAYYEEHLAKAKQVLAYVEEKLAAGVEP